MHKKKALQPQNFVLFIFMLFLLGTVVLLVNQTSVQQNKNSLASGGDCTVTTAQMQTKPQEQSLFDAINTYRVSKGLAKLTWSTALKKPAEWLSADMLKFKNLNHTDSLGRIPSARLVDCGYTNQNYGENIALGPPSAQETLTAWENSPPHNAIMLGPTYTHGAVAMETDTTGQIAYWTLDVGIASTSPTGTTIITATPSGTLTPTVSVTPTISSLTPTTDPNASQTPEIPTPTIGPFTADMQILAQVKISGIGKAGNIYPKRLTRRVKAFIFATDGTTVVANGTGYLVYDKEDLFTGVIHLGKLTQGVYYVKFVSDYTLASMAQPEFQLLKINTVNPIPPVILYQGDINSDNILALDDYNKALACFQQKICDTKEELDFNDDGITDITDYNILLHSFGQARGN